MANAIFTRKDTRRALITGASGGIGEAFARLLAAEGWELALVARNEEQLNRVAGVVHGQHGTQVHALPADLGDAEAIEQLFEKLAARDFHPDVLINNAGFGLMGPALELPRNEQLHMIDLNVRAVIDLSLRLAPHMRSQHAGGILNVASLAGFMPGPGMAVYHATKAAIISFSEALAEELRTFGVQVSVLCPGPVKTGFQARANMDKSLMMRLLPAARPEKIAMAGWQAFKAGRTIITPGALTTTLAVSSARLAPRGLLRRIYAHLSGVHRAQAGRG